MYNCEIPGCNNVVSIRNKIKSGEFKGKKACIFCKNKIDYSIKSVNKKEKKKSIDYKDYFRHGINILYKRPICQNCGRGINISLHPFNNIAHILSKKKYKSVSNNINNMLILCDDKDRLSGIGCHRLFDNKILNREFMPVFELAKIQYEKFKHLVEEKGIEYEILEK